LPLREIRCFLDRSEKKETALSRMTKLPCLDAPARAVGIRGRMPLSGTTVFARADDKSTKDSQPDRPEPDGDRFEKLGYSHDVLRRPGREHPRRSTRPVAAGKPPLRVPYGLHGNRVSSTESRKGAV
jgi:hypothetical protein